MHSNKVKRSVAFMMALILVVLILPFQAYATEIKTQSIEEPADSVVLTESVDTPIIEKVQTQIEDILLNYLGTVKMAKDDITTIVMDMDWETYQTARWEISELESKLDEYIQAGQVTEDDFLLLIVKNEALISFADALEERNNSSKDTSLYATTIDSILDGKITVTDSEGTGVLTNGVVTITVKGSVISKRTNTITITNESDMEATIAFDYTASTYNSFTIGGASAAPSGTYSKVLNGGDTVTLVIKSNSGFSNLTATLKLTNFSFVPVSANSNVTLQYDESLGSIKVAGETQGSGYSETYTKGTTVELNAIAYSGVKFLGWINTTNNYIVSSEAKFTFEPQNDITLKAIFAKDYAFFRINTSYLFETLDAASAAAKSGNMIVLANSGILPAGDYTIQEGVTLLIPYNNEDTVCKEISDKNLSRDYVKPTAFRTLTMANGANITIDGDMSIATTIHGANGGERSAGSPMGPTGFVKMEEGSSIVINNGGELYAYGYITGVGEVTAKNGAIVHECFQVEDFRGGTEISGMTGSNGVFPLSQYYLQNIEVPLTLEAGAKEYGFSAFYMRVILTSQFVSVPISFIGGEGFMFNLTSGSLTKRYDGNTDRLILKIDGTMEIGNLNMEIGGTSVQSEKYEVPINGNISVEIGSGSVVTIQQDISLLPGTEIIVEKDANIIIGSEKNVYVYDSEEWGKYCGAGKVTFLPVQYAPGRPSTVSRTDADLKDAKIQVDGTLDATLGYIYTTTSGADICSTGTGVAKINLGTQENTHQHIQGEGDTSIAITPAKLKNEDGSFLEPQVDTYNYTDGYWRCSAHPSIENCKCTLCGWESVESHNFENYVCTICGKGAYIKQKGRNLNYDDMISVIDIFEVVGLGDMELTEENSGLLIWAEEDFDANTISVTDENAINKRGLDAYPGTDYIYGESDGIWTRNLHEDAYYVGYVKLTNSDGSTKYIYSEPKLYSPSIYADNMLAKEDTDQETRDLCVALLNYISAAQMYFYPETTAEQLVNADLSDDQKDIAPEWNIVLSDIDGNLTLAPTVDNPGAKDENVFAATGKNLLFEEMISLGAVYKIEDTIVNNASDHGTIFWTPEQYDAVIADRQVPSLENAGNGEKIGLTQYRKQSGQWVSNAPKIAPKDMSDTVYYFMGYVKHSDGSVSYSGVSAYTVEQYIYNKATAETTTQKEAYMAEFAKCLYFYERAAKAAL